MIASHTISVLLCSGTDVIFSVPTLPLVICGNSAADDPFTIQLTTVIFNWCSHLNFPTDPTGCVMFEGDSTKFTIKNKISQFKYMYI